MVYLPSACQLVLAVIVIVAGIYDILYRRIPNWLTLTGVLIGFGLNSFLFEINGLRSAALGLGIALLIYFPLYLLRGMGAGDVKLMGAVGSIAGPANWLVIFIVTNLLGGVVAVILLVAKKRLLKTFSNVIYMIKEMLLLRPPYLKKEELDVHHTGAVTLPHGVMIAAGTIAYLAAAAIWASR